MGYDGLRAEIAKLYSGEAGGEGIDELCLIYGKGYKLERETRPDVRVPFVYSRFLNFAIGINYMLTNSPALILGKTTENRCFLNVRVSSTGIGVVNTVLQQIRSLTGVQQ